MRQIYFIIYPGAWSIGCKIFFNKFKFNTKLLSDDKDEGVLKNFRINTYLNTQSIELTYSQLYKISTNDKKDFAVKYYPDLLLDSRPRLKKEYETLKFLVSLLF